MKVRSYLHDVTTFLRNHWWIPWIVLPTLFLTVGIYVSSSVMYGRGFATALSTFYLVLGGLFLTAVLIALLVWRQLTPDEPDYITD